MLYIEEEKTGDRYNIENFGTVELRSRNEVRITNGNIERVIKPSFILYQPRPHGLFCDNTTTYDVTTMDEQLLAHGFDRLSNGFHVNPAKVTKISPKKNGVVITLDHKHNIFVSDEADMLTFPYRSK